MWSLINKKQSDVPKRRSTGRVVRQVTASDSIFRRNRTLTGTTSNNLASVGNKTDLESSRKHTHDLTDRRQKIFSILIVVLGSAIVLWILVSNFTAAAIVKVPSVAISKKVDLSLYEKVIQEYLDINPMGRLRFLLDQSALNTYISNKLPEVAGIVQQDMQNVGQTVFSVTMRIPVAGWKINNKQYYVDSKGIPFEQNYFLSPTVQIVDNSGVSSPQAGTAIVSNRLLSFVGRVVSESKVGGYTVTQAILPPDTTRELDIKMKDSNILVKLSIDRPAGEQVEDMGRALRYLNSRGENPGYIDVRVSGKAFYK